MTESMTRQNVCLVYTTCRKERQRIARREANEKCATAMSANDGRVEGGVEEGLEGGSDGRRDGRDEEKPTQGL